MIDSGSCARHAQSGVLEQAVDWIVLLESGRATPHDRTRFAIWRDAHADHARAWEEVSGVLRDPVAALQQAALASPEATRAARKAVLQSGPLNRRRLLKLASLGGVLALGAAGLDRYVPLANLMASYATRTGERRRFVLEDGSALTLNARSRVEVHFDARERRVVLQQGAIFAESWSDPRPFIVQTQVGRVSTSVAQFGVQRADDLTRVEVVQHAVTLQPQHGTPFVVQAPTAAAFDSARAWPHDERSQVSWRHGMLTVRDARLEDVIEQLRAYQAGVIRLSAQVANLRVFGVFPLDDPARAMQVLAETLPIRLHRYSPWLTLVDAA